MDKQQALYSFWNGFGLQAYEQNNVPDDALMPYITYSESITDIIGREVSLTASLWYFSPNHSRAEIIGKTNAIAEAIGLGGKTISFDDGMMWVKKGVPFAQPMDEPSDARVKRMVLNLSAEFISK